MIVTVDIETIPVQRADLTQMLIVDVDQEVAEELEAVKAPSNYKDPAKITAYIAEEKDKISGKHLERVKTLLQKTSLDGAYGQVCVVSYAIEEEEPVSIIASDNGVNFDDEKKVLRAFAAKMRELDGPMIVGHNVNAFDLPFLYKRAVIHGTALPDWFPIDPHPYRDSRTFDTMIAWAGGRGYIGLHRLAKLLGLESMDYQPDFDGSEVWRLVKEGRLDEVAAKAISDVELTRAIYRRMQFEAR